MNSTLNKTEEIDLYMSPHRIEFIQFIADEPRIKINTFGQSKDTIYSGRENFITEQFHNHPAISAVLYSYLEYKQQIIQQYENDYVSRLDSQSVLNSLFPNPQMHLIIEQLENSYLEEIETSLKLLQMHVLKQIKIIVEMEDTESGIAGNDEVDLNFRF